MSSSTDSFRSTVDVTGRVAGAMASGGPSVGPSEGVMGSGEESTGAGRFSVLYKGAGDKLFPFEVSGSAKVLGGAERGVIGVGDCGVYDGRGAGRLGGVR